MKITILNGNPSSDGFDRYVEEIQSHLEKMGHRVSHYFLRDEPLKYCTGCWNCWVKTPGSCEADETSQAMDREVINSDFLLWASPLRMGYISELLKNAMDKTLPLIHPYMEVVHMEAHHLKRYEHYPRVGLLLMPESDTDDTDLKIATQIAQRAALNFKSGLEFSLTCQTPVEDLAVKILNLKAKKLPLPSTPAPTQGQVVNPPASLTLFNGSPRGARGNTPIFLEQFAKGFGGKITSYNLVNVNDTAKFVEAFTKAEAVWLGFPLYVDAMPGIVKHFIEALEPLVGRPNNPPIGFIVQSGFPEGLHSRFVEQYLKKLADRLGSPYLGTIVKGNGEGVRIMPDQVNAALFSNLQALGANLAKGEALDSKILSKIAAPEKFSALLWPVFKIFLKTPTARGYFDDMLKKNGVFEKRFDQPFIEG